MSLIRPVALRKESVDRNMLVVMFVAVAPASLSARRAWIEMPAAHCAILRRLSLSARRAWIEIGVGDGHAGQVVGSLSARRAWIEMVYLALIRYLINVALRKESVDRNA